MAAGNASPTERDGAPVPAVSVLLPAFNAEPFLAHALDSLLVQTFDDVEIVVVDDGSTDRTPEIIREFAARDPRIRVLTHETNRGLVDSLNDGLQFARGELVARLDADDYAYPNRIERQFQVMSSSPDVVLCATAYQRVDTDGRVVKEVAPPLSHASLAGALLTGNCLSHSSVMFRRSAVLALGGYHREWFPAEDYDLWIRLLDVGRYQGIADVTVRYLENPDGVSSSAAAHQTVVAERRAAEYQARCSGRTEEPADEASGVDAVKALEQAARGIAASLRTRGIPRTGTYAAPLGVSLHLLRGHSRVRRHLRLLVSAPRLAVLGRLDRIRTR